MIKAILGVVFILLGQLGGGFFERYEGDSIPYTETFGWLFIIMHLLGYPLLIWGFVSMRKKEEKIVLDELDEFKKTAEKHSVDIQDCTIEVKDIEVGHEEKRKWTRATILRYETDRFGAAKEFISQPLSIDPTALEIKIALEQKMELSLYIGKDAGYLFDVELES